MRRTRWVYAFCILLCLLALELFARASEDVESADALFGWFFLDQYLNRQSLIAEGGLVEAHYELRVNERGFRDTKPWPPQSEQQGLRIVLGAAGHGYGENITQSQIYPYLLETALELEASCSVEVFNLSVQGSTIVFFERALLDEVLLVRPDVVILGYSGFNEALRSVVSDEHVVYPKRVLFNTVMGSALVRTLMMGIWSFGERAHRVGLKEYKESLRRIAKALKQNDIELVLHQQVVVYPDIEGLWKLSDMTLFRKAQREVAEDMSLSITDPLPYCEPLQSCFSRQEWYSVKGHRAAQKSLLQEREMFIDLCE